MPSIQTVRFMYYTYFAFVLFSIFNISNSCYAINVGDSYGGGTVFCVSRTPNIKQCVPHGSGDYGLIMANKDQTNFDSNPKHGVTWTSKYDVAIPAARSDDDGAANTAAIIAALPQDNPSNNAAWLCHNYRDYGKQAGQHLSGWYLPSKNELNKMYLFAKAYNLTGRDCSGSKVGEIQCLIGGYDERHKYYWSSTEYSDSNFSAWDQHFSNGNQDNYLKNSNYFGVRAVRAFNNSTKS